jgi:hypothetical protein
VLVGWCVMLYAPVMYGLWWGGVEGRGWEGEGRGVGGGGRGRGWEGEGREGGWEERSAKTTCDMFEQC